MPSNAAQGGAGAFGIEGSGGHGGDVAEEVDGGGRGDSREDANGAESRSYARVANHLIGGVVILGVYLSERLKLLEDGGDAGADFLGRG